MVAEANMLLVAHPSLPANNVAELVALAKQKPNSIAIAMSPIGTPNHLGAELLAQRAGIDLTFVLYPGIGPAMPDLLAGRTQIAISAMSSMHPHVAAGTLKALAVTRPVRSPFAPDIPTVAESGIPGFDVNAWVCLHGHRRNAGADHRAAERGGSQDDGAARGQGKLRQPGTRNLHDVAGRARALHQDRIREMVPCLKNAKGKKQ